MLESAILVGGWAVIALAGDRIVQRSKVRKGEIAGGATFLLMVLWGLLYVMVR